MSAERPSQRSSTSVSVRVRTDTIVARSTAPGRAAIAVIRVSGAGAEQVARSVITPWPAKARTLMRCDVHEPGAPDRIIDSALAVVFPAPRSYSGETTIEVHGHGGTYIAEAIEAAFVAAGARPAEPGEFTERAVLNGKLDLVRAEAIGELIDARTRAMHRSALRAASGTLSRQYAELRNAAIALEALLAYDIDFPEEDDGPIARDRVDTAATDLLAHLDGLIATAPMAALARDGALVVLAGPPNAGKSSLLNALVGESRVIVSEEPGTTRDAIEVLLDGDPWPIRLVDTAGLRDNAGTVERLGIEVSERYLKGADLVLLCGESADEIALAMSRISALTTARIVRVRTKADTAPIADTTHTDIAVSAKSGEGLGALKDLLNRAIAERAGITAGEAALVSSARQRAALETARNEVGEFLTVWRGKSLPAAIAAAHLRAALGALDELVGVIDVDDVLARVFSTFCVGK
jgi:tRNA modification GTPase